MPGLVLAWLTGEAILIYRSVHKDGRPPVPGQLLAASAIFIMLGFLAQAEKAELLATLLAWGFDIAALMNVLPDLVVGGTKTKSKNTGEVAA